MYLLDRVTKLWAERTPQDFVFNVKAFRIFTGHQTQPMVLHKDIQQALGVVLAIGLQHFQLRLGGLALCAQLLQMAGGIVHIVLTEIDQRM
mgnify:CR=1 FL=1